VVVGVEPERLRVVAFTDGSREVERGVGFAVSVRPFVVRSVVRVAVAPVLGRVVTVSLRDGAVVIPLFVLVRFRDGFAVTVVRRLLFVDAEPERSEMTVGPVAVITVPLPGEFCTTSLRPKLRRSFAWPPPPA